MDEHRYTLRDMQFGGNSRCDRGERIWRIAAGLILLAAAVLALLKMLAALLPSH